MYVKASPSISPDVWLNVKLLPSTIVWISSDGVKLLITGTSFTGVTFNVALLLETVRFSISTAVNTAYLMPVKLPSGVNATIPVLLFIEIVMLFTRVKLYFKTSPSMSEKYCVKFRELFTISSGHFHCGIVPLNTGLSFTGVRFKVILLLLAVKPAESFAVKII